MAAHEEPTPRSPNDASRKRQRVEAETPPPNFWRRWTDRDAPAPVYPTTASAADLRHASTVHGLVDNDGLPAATLTAPLSATNPVAELPDALLAELAGLEALSISPAPHGTFVTSTIATSVAAAPADGMPVVSVVLDSAPAALPADIDLTGIVTAPAGTTSDVASDPDTIDAVSADTSPIDVPASETVTVQDKSQAAVPPYRILIVEDDRSQALFAQSVLRGAGLQAEVQMQADGVLEAITRFQPDLVLMDLHMPGSDGMDLTQSIRRQPEYLHLPIVFLTGDPDPEREYEVLESGADDFLTKPIRPRHLIAAVSNRILRARLRNPAPTESTVPAVNPETGLPTRAYALKQLGALLEQRTGAGLFFIEISAAHSLRERLGYTDFESLIIQAGQRLAQAAQPHLLARLSDENFLALAPGVDAEALEGFARKLSDSVRHPAFPLRNGEALPLRAVVGCVALPQAFVDSGSALEAGERAALLARQRPGDVAVYQAQTPILDALAATLSDTTPELAFQPIVSVAGSETAHYQVLLRLRRADGTLLSAAEAIPAAEQTGRIVELDREVATQALDVLAAQRAKGVSLQLFVSQSPRSLARDDSADWLLKAIVARGVDPASLVIDLRTRDALIHTVTLRQFCQHLMSAGVQFCLAQYEPDGEAENLLTQLPLSYLRVSRRYATAHGDPVLQEQLHGIIEQAHQHGMQVIGPQVEDPQTAAAMWLGGVDFLQGNLVQSVGSELNFDFHSASL